MTHDSLSLICVHLRSSAVKGIGLAVAMAGASAVAAAAPGLTATPLASPSGGPAATMRFTELPAEQTGIVVENRYSDPRMWGERYQELTYGAIGTGVAIGDYDGDGRPDVFVVSKTETSRLFRNLGGWKFEDVTEQARLAEKPGLWDQGVAKVRSWFADDDAPSEPVPWTQGATFVDIDNDGDLDLYVCRFEAPNQLWVNQGGGTFLEEAAARGLAITDATGMAAFADFDRDGWLDVYLQTNLLNANKQPNGRRDYLLRNNGDGTFADVTDRAGIAGESAGHSATWWDFDQDGWPDMYVANDFATPDRLYRNNGDGTFTDVINDVVPHQPYYAMGADLGDVNNDGLLDFLVADMAATSHVREQRGMAGSRARAQGEPADPSHAPQVMRNALYLNTGAGRMLEAASIAGVSASDWTWSVRFEDLDNDGRVDLHITNGMNREYHNSDLLARIMGAENLGEPRRIMRASPVMAEENLAFRNIGGLQFESVGRNWNLNHRGVSFGAAFGDLDGDGDLDLVYGNYEAGPTVLRNDAPSGNRLLIALRGTRSNRFGIGAAVRIETSAGAQARQLTLARGYLSSSEPLVHFGLGDADTVRRLTVTWPSGHVQTFENIAANQRLSITEPADAPPILRATSASAALRVFEQLATPASLHAIAQDPGDPKQLQPLVPFDLNRHGPAVAVADFNGDGRDDIVLAGTTLTPARVLLSGDTSGGDARSPFATHRVVTLDPGAPATADDGAVLPFDADGDGAIDILLTRAGVRDAAGSDAYQPVLWLNRGGGRFIPVPEGAFPSLTISSVAAAAADFDRDGDVDTFIGGRSVPGRYPEPARSALLRNDGGRFSDITDALAPSLAQAGLVTAVLWSDVDADGWPDLLLALEWGPVRVFRNVEGSRFEDVTESTGFAAAGNGWWTSLAAADLNGDGRMDYVAGNAGLNTPYAATLDEPLLLLWGDFGGRGEPLVVETIFEQGRLYPRRTRNELAAHLPSIARRFPRNDVFARTTLEEVLTPERFAAAMRFTATELRSGVFLSTADGRFEFRAFPRAAQLAPVEGILTTDIDEDGHVDLLVVQNSHAPAPVTGRFDGGLGLWLRGDGRGNFDPVPAAESGWIVPGDADAIVRLDADGDGSPEFLVSRNRDAFLLFRRAKP